MKMGLLITFVLSYAVTTGVYYLWYIKRNTLEKNNYLKKILYFALSVAVMMTAMYYLVDELEILLIIFSFVGVVLVTDNVLIHAYFQKGDLDIKKIDYLIPGVINTTILFALIYLLLF